MENKEKINILQQSNKEIIGIKDNKAKASFFRKGKKKHQPFQRTRSNSYRITKANCTFNQKNSSNFNLCSIKSLNKSSNSKEGSLSTRENFTSSHKSSISLQHDKEDSHVDNLKLKLMTGKKIEYKPYDSTKLKTIRTSYYTKLKSKNLIELNENISRYNSIIIFDWDDTLFLTHYLRTKNALESNEALTPERLRRIKKLESNVMTILNMAINKGHTYIITNAKPGWVELQSARLYPSIKPFLQKVKIISSQGLYGSLYPCNPRRWKIASFIDIAKEYNCKFVTNLICIGDSQDEMEAVKNLSALFKNVVYKRAKFKETPDLNNLTNEIKLLIKNFDSLYSMVNSNLFKMSNENKK